MIDTSTDRLLATLKDIASNIHIESEFCIRHPNYHPFALPTKVANKFRENPEALQQKYLNLLLRNFIYGIYYNGCLQNILALDGYNKNFSPHQNLETNPSQEIDWMFYQRLHASNHGAGYYDPGWYIAQQEPDGSLMVTKGGLTLHVERHTHLELEATSAKVHDYVAIWMPKNRLQNGFYVAVSNFGQERQGNPDGDLGTGRIYFHLSPRGAIAIMDILTHQLNAAAVPFSFKVLYNPLAYGRYDSGVLYFERNNFPAVQRVLREVYELHKSYFLSEVPLFTKFLAPGLSVAEEPNRKFTAQESFGMNRCQIVANALLEAWQKGDNSTAEKMRIIDKHFAQMGIDLHHPYLNQNSEDIYYLF